MTITHDNVGVVVDDDGDDVVSGHAFFILLLQAPEAPKPSSLV